MIETLYNNDGHPRVWPDGSHVMIAFDVDGIDWEETRKANPWAVQREAQSSVPAKRANLSTAFDRIRDRFKDHMCHDCGAFPGEAHEPGCDVERCPICGGQMIACACDSDFRDSPQWRTEIIELGGLLPWTGTWPGVREAIEYDFWCRWTLLAPSERNRYATSGWVRCDKTDQGSKVDLNRVIEECTWDKHQRRWVRQPQLAATSETS